MARLSTPIDPRDHSVGPAHAAVTLVEYGDFECPYCGRAYPVIQALRQRLGTQLRLVFRNFPIVELHPHAEPAAEAAEAAAAQGRFWMMHDLLFENQRVLGPAALDRYGRALELDMDRYSVDVKERVFAARIDADVKSGVMSGVEGTPTFFFNGVRHEGAHDLGSLLASAIVAAPGLRI